MATLWSPIIDPLGCPFSSLSPSSTAGVGVSLPTKANGIQFATAHDTPFAAIKQTVLPNDVVNVVIDIRIEDKSKLRDHTPRSVALLASLFRSRTLE